MEIAKGTKEPMLKRYRPAKSINSCRICQDELNGQELLIMEHYGNHMILNGN